MEAKDKLLRLGELARSDGAPCATPRTESSWRGLRARGSIGQPRCRRAARAHLATNLRLPTGSTLFGWDPDTPAMRLPRPRCSRSYFRTIVSGIENIPAGRVLIVANHSGHIPLDGLIIAISVFLEANPPRLVRAMVEKWSQTVPFVSTFFAKCGQVVGVPENAHRLLTRGEALLVFPEGIKGLAKTFQHRYELTEFGLGFMRLALETEHADLPLVGHRRRRAIHQCRQLAVGRQSAAFARVPAHPAALDPGRTISHSPRAIACSSASRCISAGDPDDDDAVIEEKVWVVKATIQSMINQGLMDRKSLFF